MKNIIPYSKKFVNRGSLPLILSFICICLCINNSEAEPIEMCYHKKFIVGHFCTAQHTDTIWVHYYSHKSESILDSIPSSNNTTESVEKWFMDNQIEVQLCLSNKSVKGFSNARGISLLTKIENVNSDGIDYVVVVVDYFDYSCLNSCLIYALFENKWAIVNQFTINEIFLSNQNKTHPDFLIKEDDVWFYWDYEDYSQFGEKKLIPIK